MGWTRSRRAVVAWARSGCSSREWKETERPAHPLDVARRAGAGPDPHTPKEGSHDRTTPRAAGILTRPRQPGRCRAAEGRLPDRLPPVAARQVDGHLL